MEGPSNEAERRYLETSEGIHMIRCIQQSPNGPIIQGPAQLVGRRNFSTGEPDLTGEATIKCNGVSYTGKLIESVRKP